MKIWLLALFAFTITAYLGGYWQAYGEGWQAGYVETPVPITKYIEHTKVIYQEVIKEVVVEKPVELREFASIDELEIWLAEDDTDEFVYLFAGKDGTFRPSDKYDCDDYALQLQKRALDAGFVMSATIIWEQGRHMINLVCIGNDVYHIEPQTDEVWFFCHRD